VEYYFTKMLF